MKPTFSLAIRSATILALASLVAGMTPPARTLLAVRRSVALVLSIDAPTYWDRLDQSTACGPKCRELQRALEDPVRAALARKFAFADWRPSATAPSDTVQVRWVEKPPPATPGAWIEFRLIGAAGRAHPDSLRVDFEEFSNMIDRPDWIVHHVRDQWVRRLSTILERADLVPLLFGRISVNVQVPFPPGLARVRVPISGTDIGAAADTRPVFRVVARIDDPGPPSSSDIGEVILTGCIGIASYVCDIGEVRYPGGKIMAGPALTNLLARRPTMKTVTVHLQSYSAGNSALVAPGGER
jgi:hypothetical protein